MTEGKRAPENAAAPFRESYDQHVACPWCKSERNEVANPFGGTVSEITFRCLDCKNTFGWMKWEKRLPE